MHQFFDKYNDADETVMRNSGYCENSQTVDSFVVNNIINPTKRYFDTINDIQDNDVEGNIDQLFKIESLGIRVTLVT